MEGTDIQIFDKANSYIPQAAFQGTSIEDSGTGVIDTNNINFADNLTVTDDGDGTVTVDAASGGGGGGGVNVSEDGTQVLSGATDLNFTESGAASATVTDDGDGTVLASRSTADGDFTESANNSNLVGFALSDYSRIPGAETVTVVVECSNLNNSKYPYANSPSVSNRLIDLSGGQTLYPGRSSGTTDFSALAVDQVTNADNLTTSN